MAENYIITKKARKNMVQARAGAITLPKMLADIHTLLASHVCPGSVPCSEL